MWRRSCSRTIMRSGRGHARRCGRSRASGEGDMETLNDILEESARKFGNKDAFIIRPGFRTRAWTSRDMNDVVPRVARYLSDSGMKKGDRVLIWGVNRPEYGIAFLAALRLGAILVPLEANYAAEFAEKIAERPRPTGPSSRRAPPGGRNRVA